MNNMFLSNKLTLVLRVRYSGCRLILLGSFLAYPRAFWLPTDTYVSTLVHSVVSSSEMTIRVAYMTQEKSLIFQIVKKFCEFGCPKYEIIIMILQLLLHFVYIKQLRLVEQYCSILLYYNKECKTQLKM